MAFLVGIPVLWALAGFISWTSFAGTARSEFGEMFGGLNTLCSMFALGGVLLALIFQWQELNHTAEVQFASRRTEVIEQLVEQMQAINSHFVATGIRYPYQTEGELPDGDSREGPFPCKTRVHLRDSSRQAPCR